MPFSKPGHQNRLDMACGTLPSRSCAPASTPSDIHTHTTPLKYRPLPESNAGACSSSPRQVYNVSVVVTFLHTTSIYHVLHRANVAAMGNLCSSFMPKLQHYNVHAICYPRGSGHAVSKWFSQTPIDPKKIIRLRFSGALEGVWRKIYL